MLAKAEKLLDLRVEIAEQELRTRKAFPFPVDLYGPRGTEIRFPDPPNPLDTIITC